MHASYHKDPMLQEHRLPRARGGGTATATAAAPRDPLQAQDVSVRRRHLHTYVRIHLSIYKVKGYIHAKTLYLFVLFFFTR